MNDYARDVIYGIDHLDWEIEGLSSSMALLKYDHVNDLTSLGDKFNDDNGNTLFTSPSKMAFLYVMLEHADYKILLTLSVERQDEDLNDKVFTLSLIRTHRINLVSSIGFRSIKAFYNSSFSGVQLAITLSDRAIVMTAYPNVPASSQYSYLSLSSDTENESVHLY